MYDRLNQNSRGRPIATEFLSLPDRDLIPEYYDIIKLPVALETIEEKLKRDAYPTVSALEGDLKRLVQNAKDFNDPRSEIFEDAERIRKLVFNFMKVNNPAYKEDPKYSATPTPLPSRAPAVQNGVKREASESLPEPREKPKIILSARTSEQPDKQTSVASSGATLEDEDGEDGDGEGQDDIDFTGKTFQEAQQAMISYLLHFHDEE
jgi:hypothetical protein